MLIGRSSAPWPAVMGTVGRGGASRPHAHHALHVVVCKEGRLRVRGKSGPWRSSFGVVTAPDVPHALDAEGREVALVFVEPESDVGAELLRAMKEEIELLPAIFDPSGEMVVRRAIAALGGSDRAPVRALHPRVKRVLATLNQGGDPSLATLARLAGLSEGRLMHAFTESVGIPLRPYVLWLKVQRAAFGIATGLPLAQAATTAGFADAAHMTRTFRRMFGMTPSAIRSQLVQAARG
jgi:AraC-like DNA-binding protein